MEQKDKEGLTALDLAEAAEHDSIIALINSSEFH